MRQLKNALTYLAINGVSRLPFFILYRFADLLYFLLSYVIGYRKQVIYNNLKNSFPDKSDDEIKKIRKQFYRNFSDQMLESLKLLTISKKDLAERLEYDTPDDLLQWVEKNRSVVVAAGHYGNWEYPSGFPFKIPGFDQYNVIYSKISNPYIDKLVLESRERYGCHMISMKNTFREILKHENKGNFYGFIFDQSPHKSLVRYDLQFLNQTTPVHLGTEQVAAKKNAVVVYLEVYRVKRGYYRVKSEIVTEQPKELEKYELTHILFNKLEESIKKDPASWLWSHKRWKYKAGIDYQIN